MTHTFQITDLRKNSYFDLNEGATDGVMLSLEGVQLFTRDKQPIFHVGSDGQQQMIACHEGARGAAFQINLGGTRNTAYNRLHRLNRWLERAIDAELNPDNSWPIYLKIKLDGATNATIHRIQFGMTDPSGAILTPFPASGAGTDTEIYLWMVGVTLVLYPTGTLETPYYLNNMLRNGAFDRWNAAETAPLNWQIVSSGVLTKSLYGLIGRYSCQVTAGANGRGIRSDSTAVPAGHLAILSAWVLVSSGTWKLQIWSGSELVALENITAAALAANTGSIVQDTAVDRTGTTWYLVMIALANITTDRNMFARWTLQTGDTGTSWIDGMQLHTVEAANRFPDPHIQSFDNNTWGDFFKRGGTLGFATIVQTTSAHFDADGEFATTASALDVTWDTVTSANMSLRTVLMNPHRQDDSWIARFWVRFANDGGTSLKATLYDGADNVIDSVTWNEENQGDQDIGSATGGDTVTWYQFELSGTNSEAPGVYVQWEPTATGAGVSMHFYLDELFVYSGTGPVFNGAFISEWTMLNRNDYDDSNTNRFNYFHMFNLPGDAPCRIKLNGYIVGADTPRQFWLATAHEQRYPYIEHSYEAENETYWTPRTEDGALWTGTAGGATESGASYNRFASTSDTPTLGSGRSYIKMSIPDATRLEENHRWGANPLRVFVRARTSEAASAYINFELLTQNETVTRANTYRSFTADDTWEWIDLGPLLLHYNDDGARTLHNISGVFRIYVECDNTETVDIDKVEFLPTPDGGYGRWRFYEFGTFGQFLLDGVKEEMTYLVDGTDVPTPYSGVYKFLPGHISHVLIAGTANNSNVHAIGEKIDFTSVAIYPQTTHLLGTI
jgi:hypothetical protein